MVSKSRQPAAKSDPIFAQVARYHSLGRKIDSVCGKMDSIRAKYPVGWFDCAEVTVGMFHGGERRRPITADTHEEVEAHRQHNWDIHTKHWRLDRDPKWVEKFNATWRGKHEQLDAAIRLERSRREASRHDDVGETYQNLSDTHLSTVELYTAQRIAIAKLVPTTLEGHLFKLALFIKDQADGLENEEDSWANIREAMNGLPHVPKWKRFVPKKSADAEGGEK